MSTRPGNAAIPGSATVSRRKFMQQMGLPSMTDNLELEVEFPDGSTLEFEVELSRDVQTGEVKLNFTAVPGSAQSPELSFIPIDPAEFPVLLGNEIFGDGRFIEGLGDLFVRGGGRLDRDRSGGGCTGRAQCWTEIDEEGNERERCRVILPKKELMSC